MAVAFDAKPTAWNSADGLNQEATSTPTSISASTGFTVGGSASLLVGVLVYEGAGGTDPGALSSWTWNGVAATGILESGLHSSGTDRMRAAIAWWNGPATGTKTMTASWPTGAGGGAYMSAASFTGSDATTPVVTADNQAVNTGSGNMTVTVTSDANGMTVVVGGTNGGTPTVNFNKIFAEAPLGPGGGASYQAAGTSNAHSFTGWGGTAPVGAGIHIQAAAGGAAAEELRLMALGVGA